MCTRDNVNIEHPFLKNHMFREELYICMLAIECLVLRNVRWFYALACCLIIRKQPVDMPRLIFYIKNRDIN